MIEAVLMLWAVAGILLVIVLLPPAIGVIRDHGLPILRPAFSWLRRVLPWVAWAAVFALFVFVANSVFEERERTLRREAEIAADVERRVAAAAERDAEKAEFIERCRTESGREELVQQMTLGRYRMGRTGATVSVNVRCEKALLE